MSVSSGVDWSGKRSVRLKPDNIEGIAERTIALLQDQPQQPPARFVDADTLGEAPGAREEVLAACLESIGDQDPARTG
jgi:hypothetical protein